MSHIPEGDLHAWLDGGLAADSPEGRSLQAHLEACEACRIRYEEAKRLRSAADAVLAGATPGEDVVPPFREIARRAQDEVGGSASRGGGVSTSTRWPGWRSIERLAWAATVVLALGAGWIGREILVERGWTDPFHPTAEGSAGSPAATELSRGAVGEAPTDEGAPEGFVAAPEEEKARRDLQVLETDRGRKEVPEERPAAELMAEPRQRAKEGADADALALQPPLDAWHRVPNVGDAEAPLVCYALSVDWLARAGLPEQIRLTGERETEGGAYRGAVLSPGVASATEIVWMRVPPDSLWLRIVPTPGSDFLTARVRRSTTGYRGEGRLVSLEAPVSPDARAGPVDLVRIACPDP